MAAPQKTKLRLFDSPKLDSRIRSANVQRSEKWIGYFGAPAIIMCMFYMCGQSYLNTFYTDVLHMTTIGGGLFLTLLPIISKILDAITNLIMGQIVEKTRSRQGKARPWVLLSGPLLAITGILLFTVPTSSITAQVIWVTVSYNLYFCMAFTMYNISHTLMIPLSTRNSRQRDTLAMFVSMGTSMIPGMIVSMLFPMLILPLIGVDQGKWITVMGVISILALPAVLLEYYFTRERVTEENSGDSDEQAGPSMMEQLRGCFKSKYWVTIMAIIVVQNLYNNFQVTGSLYYANWVLGTYNDSITYTLMNAVGQAPLGFGVILLWPLVRKWGKGKCMVIGSMVSVLGNIVCTLAPTNMPVVLAGLALRAFGNLPITYTLMAMVADALDHVEWLNGYRCDGFSSSVYSIIITVTVGISTGLFNLGLSAVGYVAPLSDGTWVPQAANVKNYFVIAYYVVPAVACLLIGILASFYKIDKELPAIQSDIITRHKEAAAAKGLEWLSSEEQAAREQAENDRIAEENRIAELKAKCAKKGLNFAEEEAKYQQKLAEKKAKEAAKAAKKTKKK